MVRGFHFGCRMRRERAAIHSGLRERALTFLDRLTSGVRRAMRSEIFLRAQIVDDACSESHSSRSPTRAFEKISRTHLTDHVARAINSRSCSR